MPDRPARPTRVETPDWLTAGDAVGLLHHGTGRARATVRNIARFTKTRVVLDDDSWFPLDVLRRYDGSHRRTDLVPLTDPDFLRVAQNQAIEAAVYKLEQARRSWPLGGPTWEQLAEVRALALTLVDAVDAAGGSHGS